MRGRRPINTVGHSTLKISCLCSGEQSCHSFAENEANEPGQEVFEWFLSGHDVHIYERYSDADAAVAHVGRFVENFAGRFLDLCTPTRMSVYGDATDKVKAATAGFNPSFYGPIAGHARG